MVIEHRGAVLPDLAACHKNLVSLQNSGFACGVRFHPDFSHNTLCAEGEKRSPWQPPGFCRSIGNWLPAGDTGAPFAENKQTSRRGNAACDCAKSLLS